MQSAPLPTPALDAIADFFGLDEIRRDAPWLHEDFQQVRDAARQRELAEESAWSDVTFARCLAGDDAWLDFVVTLLVPGLARRMRRVMDLLDATGIDVVEPRRRRLLERVTSRGQLTPERLLVAQLRLLLVAAVALGITGAVAGTFRPAWLGAVALAMLAVAAWQALSTRLRR
ncbi:hypothetical protein P873_01245 [Arenimonas composti TR7-09 = DSM 18010]|uniref:Uncharacterized protein n=1 Tax=Arenimonas composti TR7-09 = DSM 18010 TaxID=1121013 RepID=A0A091BXA5_9GAMM|nr:hypothetical protein [Arenimonas composti]KFN48955.1 hypothetical protein P873_01245 [Arenimonas composti TR7-09 = DSM 18010]